MNKQQSTQLAQQLLDSEFADFNHNPSDYCLSMGWSKGGDGYNKALEKKGQLSPSAEDIENLASIIESCGTDDTIEITERNSVSDFLCNCVAGHIIK